MSFILALDQGTTSSRAIIFDEQGQMRAVAQREFPQLFPKPGWVEHDPDEIWFSQLGVAQEAIARAKIRAGDLAAIGIANQRETVLVWDRRTGKPIHNAIVWQDRRTAAMCERLQVGGHERTFEDATGLRLDPYFSGTKIAWLLEHVDGALDRAKAGELAFGTVDSWLIYKLTEGQLHITDASNASRTLLYNIHTLDWDDNLLNILGVPRAIMPSVRPCSERYGETRSDVLGAAVPIAGIAGDQQAALFGQQCTSPGMGKNTYGTGCFLLQQVGAKPLPSRHNLLTTIAWQLGGETCYALEGSVFVAGAVVQWLRDGLGIIRESSEVEALAQRVPDSGGAYLVPAFTGLGAPHWDAHARGAMVGLTRGTTAAHIARAALESIAFQSADLIRAIEADSGQALSELRVDGGASMNDLLMQIQSDLLGVPVVRPRIAETTALGAAYLAGLAVGVWSGTDAIADQWQVDQRFEPTISRDVAALAMNEWRRAVDRAKGWAVEA